MDRISMKLSILYFKRSHLFSLQLMPISVNLNSHRHRCDEDLFFHLCKHLQTLMKCRIIRYFIWVFTFAKLHVCRSFKNEKGWSLSVRLFVRPYVRSYFLPLLPSVTKYISVTTYQEAYILNKASARDFQQFDILTSVDSDGPLQPPVMLRNSKWRSVSSLTLIEYSSDKQRLWSGCAYAQAGLRLCWSHIPNCWKSHALALDFSFPGGLAFTSWLQIPGIQALGWDWRLKSRTPKRSATYADI